MNKIKSVLLGVCIAMMLLAGCARQQEAETLEQICLQNTNKPEVAEAAEKLLRRMHFKIEKSDAQQGIVRTHPLCGAQWFEFWRSDNAGRFNSKEANLHSIRRIAELDIAEQNGQICVNCNVQVQKLNLPEQEVTGTSQAESIFSESGISTEGLNVNAGLQEGISWIDLGTDEKLATKILRQIEKRIAKQN